MLQVGVSQVAICLLASQIANYGESYIGATLQDKEGFEWVSLHFYMTKYWFFICDDCLNFSQLIHFFILHAPCFFLVLTVCCLHHQMSFHSIAGAPRLNDLLKNQKRGIILTCHNCIYYHLNSHLICFLIV